MPSLNFLKKKRTREEKPDSSSQPASPVTPVTPTHSKPFESSNSLVKSPTQSSYNTRASSSTIPQLPQVTNSSKETPALAGGGPQMNPSVTHHQQAPYGLQHTPSPGHGSMPHNLPSINNLINIPQNDGEWRRTRNLPVFSS